MSNKPFGTKNLREAFHLVHSETGHLLDSIDCGSVERLIDEMGSAKRLYVTGMGRSGLVAKAFAVRLVHLGFITHVVGEVTAPAIGPQDLLIAISGSGTTRTVLAQSEAALCAGSRLAAITAVIDSPLAHLAGESAGTVHLPTCLGVRHRAEGLVETRQFGGSLFEQTAFLLLDSVVLAMAARRNKTEQDMRSRHANLE